MAKKVSRPTFGLVFAELNLALGQQRQKDQCQLNFRSWTQEAGLMWKKKTGRQ